MGSPLQFKKVEEEDPDGVATNTRVHPPMLTLALTLTLTLSDPGPNPNPAPNPTPTPTPTPNANPNPNQVHPLMPGMPGYAGE